MSKLLIHVENMVKTYIMGDVQVHALRGVSLAINEGEFVAIMGPSGSGKTTFMNMIGCLDKPTSGVYNLDGIDVHTLPSEELSAIRNSKIGFVFQSFYLLPRTTAQENVELPLLYRTRLGRHEVNERSLAALKTVGLHERAHHYPNQLSGGQQQRVAIARAIVNEPVFLLADEPTGNLDTRTSIEVLALFQDIHSHGKTIIMVTHESDIAQYAQRWITFRDGHVKSDVINPHPRVAREDLANLPPDEEI